MPVQHWVTTLQPTHVGEVRRAVVAYSGEHGVPRAVLTNIAIAVSEMMTNAVVHGDAADTLTVDADIHDGEVVVMVRGASVGLTPALDGAASRLRMLIVAAVADDVRIGSTGDGGAEVSMSFRHAARAPSAAESAEPSAHAD